MRRWPTTRHNSGGLISWLLAAAAASLAWCRDDGLARTPPMGWLSWTRFQCQTDCGTYPNDCVDENLYKSMADRLSTGGYLAAGYNYLNVDDCWSERLRDDEGLLQANRQRFPGGIAALSDYVHKLGLRFGLYATFGRRTCMGFAGTLTHEQMAADAESMRRWNVDYLKFDGCFNDPKTLDDGYIAMAAHLNATGRPIVYSCSWPYYLLTDGKIEPSYELISRHCHLWRNYHDITISWQAILAIINFYDANQDKLSRYHGPGQWNDPDMIVVGNSELSARHSRVQMAMWSMYSAPLLMSNDLRRVPAYARALLLNPLLIAVDQDPMGAMAVRLRLESKLRVYRKPLFGGKSYAFAFLNAMPDQTLNAKFNFDELQLPVVQGGYSVLNLLTGTISDEVLTGHIEVTVPPEDIVAYKLIAPDDKSRRRSYHLLPSPLQLDLSFFNKAIVAALVMFALVLCVLPKRYKMRALLSVVILFCVYCLVVFKVVVLDA